MSESTTFSIQHEEERRNVFIIPRRVLYAAGAGFCAGFLLTCVTAFLFSFSSCPSVKISTPHISTSSPPTTTSPPPTTTSPPPTTTPPPPTTTPPPPTTSPSPAPQSQLQPLPCTHKNKTFTIFAEIKKNWFEAMADCLSKDMQFASIENEIEYQEVLRLIRDMPAEAYWLSGTNLGHEPGAYVWMSTGHKVTYHRWHRVAKIHEPNNAAGICNDRELEHCMELKKEFNYEMNDYCCYSPQCYICEQWKCVD